MLINKNLAGKKVATQFGQIEFNEKGESKGLKADEEKFLGKLHGFSYKQEKKEAPKQEKKEAPKQEKKEEPKKDAAKKPVEKKTNSKKK